MISIEGYLDKLKVTRRKISQFVTSPYHSHWKEKWVIPVQFISFLLRNIRNFFFIQILLIIWGYVMILIQVHFESSRSLEGIVHNLLPVHTFLMEKLWKFPLHIKIANDLRICHDLDPRSFVKVKSYCLKKCTIHL